MLGNRTHATEKNPYLTREASHVAFKVSAHCYNASLDGLRPISPRPCRGGEILCAIKRRDDRRTSGLLIRDARRVSGTRQAPGRRPLLQAARLGAANCLRAGGRKASLPQMASAFAPAEVHRAARGVGGGSSPDGLRFPWRPNNRHQTIFLSPATLNRQSRSTAISNKH
jgi:hypothetical protein